MKIAIIGTVGVPANYGGFETLVEQLIKHNHSEELQYAVYCSSKNYKDHRWVYNGAKTEYVGLNANGIQSIPYDIISLIRAARNSDCILILGVSGCAFLPIFRLFSKKRLIINIDGLEHKRDKWNKYARWILKFSEKQAVRYGDVIVTDNKGITDYVREEYNKPSELIAYGGDHVLRDVSEERCREILSRYDLTPKEYSLAICRIEPENNVHTMLEAYAGTNEKFIFVGNWDKNEYGKKLKDKYKSSQTIVIQPAIYDLDELYALRANCKLYIHGHSAGGTNPSLVEAMHFGVPIIAYDCIYNRESTENKGDYFKDIDQLKTILLRPIESFKKNAESMKEIANRRYRWGVIAQQYVNLYSHF